MDDRDIRLHDKRVCVPSFNLNFGSIFLGNIHHNLKIYGLGDVVCHRVIVLELHIRKEVVVVPPFPRVPVPLH